VGDHTVIKPHGYTVVVGEFGLPVENDTLQCCHCGMHWQVIRGSGRRRGWCTGCTQVTCGAKACVPCIPQEMRCEEPDRAFRRAIDEGIAGDF